MTQNETASTRITAVRATALAVRTSVSAAAGEQHGQIRQRGPELAEQLNNETRQKYVKGVLNDKVGFRFQC